MGRAGRWLRSFFVTGRKGRKAKDRDKQADADSQSVSSAALPTPASTPSAREKRRWSFRRPAAAVASKVDVGAAGGQDPLAPSSSQCFSEAEARVVVVQDQRAAAVTVPEAAAASVVPLPPPPVSESRGGGDGEEVTAAIKIQSAFRSYLARKALCALRGMVKLQAMVRGQLVRRQASLTLRRMQALVDAQMRARAERLRLLEEDDGRQLATATPPPSRRSPQHARSRKPRLEAAERSSEKNVIKIVEVDDGGEAPRVCARRDGGSCYSTPLAKAELYQKVSPAPSALTDASARTLSGRFDDASLTSASEPSRRKAWRAPPFPSYMANTESSRAKARSQSAPRQRFAASESMAASASPSPSCVEQPPSGSGSGGARRRTSLDPLDLLGARAAAHWSCSGRVERCASRARARAGVGASVPSSECGSPAWRE